MELLLDWFAAFSVGVLAYLAYRKFYLKRLEQQIQQVLQEHVQKFLAESVHSIKEEQHDGVTFWYDEHSGAFLAQGADEVQLIENIKSRFPSHIFVKEGAGVLARDTGWAWEETVKVESTI